MDAALPSPSGRSTEAAVVRSPGAPFVLSPVTLSPPRPDEVVVEVEACGVCHADLAASAGEMPFPLPGVLGHEGLGRILEVGSGVETVRVGQRVVVSSASCGHCPQCLGGAPVYCQDWPRLNLFGGARGDGSDTLAGELTGEGAHLHGHFFGQSAFSRHLLTKARAVIPVPEDLPAAVLAPLGCGVMTGVGAATLVLQPAPGDRVAVFGAGAVGLSAVMGLKLTGAAQIIAVDIHDSRLELARELGATETINARNVDVAEEMASLTQGAGLNGAIETSGVASSLQAAISSLRASGICVVVGVPADLARAGVDLIELVSKGLRLVGTNQGDANPHTFIPRLIELHRRGRLPVERLVTSFAFSEINDAAAASSKGQAIKPVLHMS